MGVAKSELFRSRRSGPPDLLEQGTGFQKQSWYFCIHRQIELASKELTHLASHSDIVIVRDCDLQFFPNRHAEWQRLCASFLNSGNVVWFMKEMAAEDQCNTGFYMTSRKHANTLSAFLDEVRVHPMMDKGLADQDVINLLKDSIDYGLIDPKYVVWADKVPPDTNEVLFHHAVATSDKMEQMRMVWNKIVEERPMLSNDQ